MRLPERKVLDPIESDKNYVILAFVVCSASIAYNSLCRGLEYLLKIPYFIQNCPNVVWFLIFKTLCLGRSKLSPYVWKIYHKNEWFSCLIEHIFTKLLQNACLINTHILMYWYIRCNCKLWSAICFYYDFRVYSYIIDDHLWLNCCISNKLSQIVCLINVNILVCQYTKYDCKLWKVFWFNCVFWAYSLILLFTCSIIVLGHTMYYCKK